MRAGGTVAVLNWIAGFLKWIGLEVEMRVQWKLVEPVQRALNQHSGVAYFRLQPPAVRTELRKVYNVDSTCELYDAAKISTSFSPDFDVRQIC